MFRGLVIATILALWVTAVVAAPAAPGSPLADGAAATAESHAEAVPVAPRETESHWAARSTLSEGSFRSALSRGRLDLGVMFDAPVRTVRPGEAPTDPAFAYLPPAPTLTIGLRSTPADPVASAGSLIERATGATFGQRPERKFGLEWKPARSRVFLNRGLGIRLDGDDRLTMRLKKGSLGLFMHAAF